MYISSPTSSMNFSQGIDVQALNIYSTVPSEVEKWSSFIGIVTAICGNIFISFALNTQRYAHIRLSRETQKSEELQRLKKRQKAVPSYGTQQNAVAEERARANAKSEPGQDSLEPPDSNETDALIPSVDSLDTRKASRSSEDSSGVDEDEDASKEKSYLKSPIWWVGITLMIFGEAGNFLAYGFAPASIVSPLGVVALISNCLIAPLLLRERFRWRDGIGVIISVAGCVTIVMSASDSNPKLDPDSIWHLITRWEFTTYLIVTVGLIIALCWASNKFGEKTILIDLGLVALFGAYTALSTKGVASLLSNTIWRVVTFPITYLLVAVLVFTAVMQIKYINRALQRFNATMVIPTQFVLFTISVIVGSAVLYRDFERTTPRDAAEFFAGCALTFLGVWCITSGRGDDSQLDEELGEDEDPINLVDEERVAYEVREREENAERRQSLIAGSSKLSPAERPRIDLDEPPLDNAPVKLPPAISAAIHDDSSILPDSSHPGIAVQKPPMHATTSDPVLPQVDSSFTTNAPMKRGASAYNPTTDRPVTPTSHHPASRLLESPDPHNLLKHRRPVVGILPGPFTSPLSSSLSAIVADSLRRGVDLPPTTARRRSRRKQGGRADSSRGSAVIADDVPRKRHSIGSGHMDFEDEDTAELRASSGGTTGRVRSVSATLGDIFGSSKR